MLMRCTTRHSIYYSCKVLMKMHLVSEEKSKQVAGNTKKNPFWRAITLPKNPPSKWYIKGLQEGGWAPCYNAGYLNKGLLNDPCLTVYEVLG
jgi:hypothetical protein